MTLAALLSAITDDLFLIARDRSQSEAEQILCHVFTFTRSDLVRHAAQEVSADQIRICKDMAQRRLSHEPLPYIFESTYFYNTEVKVSRDVLIPRPDTEILVNAVLETFNTAPIKILDLCTGSGAIAAALHKERPTWTIIDSDISKAACKLAHTNAPECPVICTDLFETFKPRPYFDAIVCNPPYITGAEMINLDDSVKQFEPFIALWGGSDGLRFYRTIASGASLFCTKGARIFCEIGSSQGESVPAIFKREGWQDITVRKDLAQHDRVVTARLD